MTSSWARPDFNLADGHEYMLCRSHAASSRLNLQYYLWKESLHCNIHPSIRLHSTSRIADVATGTAIWLTNVAREYPSAQLDGFDIDISQAPPMQWLAPNITLRTWNIFDPVPEELIGIYDVVHVRLLALVVQKNNLRDVIRTLLRLLRPGGYIQWDELNYTGTHIETSKNSAHTPALHELRKRVYSEGRNDWTLRLPDLFTDQGLLDNKIYHFKDLPDLIRANGEQHLLTMEEFALSLERNGHREAAADLFKLVQDAGNEMSGGAALSMPRLVCVGRKAGGGSSGK